MHDYISWDEAILQKNYCNHSKYKTGIDFVDAPYFDDSLF